MQFSRASRCTGGPGCSHTGMHGTVQGNVTLAFMMYAGSPAGSQIPVLLPPLLPPPLRPPLLLPPLLPPLVLSLLPPLPPLPLLLQPLPPPPLLLSRPEFLCAKLHTRPRPSLCRVRPGRFMQCLNAVQAEMLEPSSAEPGSGPAAGDAALERLESIRREALEVLLEMAGEGQPYLP